MTTRIGWTVAGLFSILLFALLVAPRAHASENQPALPAGDDRVTIHVVIGVDISRGSPFITETPLPGKAARRISDMVADLPFRALVSLRTFGGHSTAKAEVSVDRQISRNQTAGQTAYLIEQLISGMPKLVRDGTLVAHDKSSIVGFLHSMSRSIRCDDRPTVLVLATDGIEDSDIADLRNGGSLPKPREIFEGCTRLEMLGLGQGAGSFEFTEKLIAEWREWAQAAGFAIFVGLDTW